MYKYRAKMVKIIDGDTLDALVDLGFDVQIRRRIRLKGINAPESRTKDLAEKKLGLAAKRRLEELLGPSEGVFVLISHGLGKYGRCLGEIFVEEGEESINQQLINEGHAREYKV
jgi:micrococcal nuclease